MSKKEIKPIIISETPITDEMFISQGWEKHEFEEPNPYNDDEDEDDVIEYYMWVLPLPKDNPDDYAPCLISSANDEWEVLELNEGEYLVELGNTNGLGLCSCVESVDMLYHVLTGCDINDS